MKNCKQHIKGLTPFVTSLSVLRVPFLGFRPACLYNYKSLVHGWWPKYISMINLTYSDQRNISLLRLLVLICSRLVILAPCCKVFQINLIFRDRDIFASLGGGRPIIMTGPQLYQAGKESLLSKTNLSKLH